MVKAIYEDLVVGRTPLEWAYLIIMSIVPIIVALRDPNQTSEVLSSLLQKLLMLFLVAEGKSITSSGLSRPLLYDYVSEKATMVKL